MEPERHCPQCNKPLPTGSKKTFCSATCAIVGYNSSPQQRKTYVCVCRQCLTRFASCRKTSQYCSKKCSNKAARILRAINPPPGKRRNLIPGQREVTRKNVDAGRTLTFNESIAPLPMAYELSKKEAVCKCHTRQCECTQQVAISPRTSVMVKPGKNAEQVTAHCEAHFKAHNVNY